MLRSSLARREQELEETRLRMMELMQENEKLAAISGTPPVEFPRSPQTTGVNNMNIPSERIYDIHAIREIKQKLMYLQQIETGAAARLRRVGNSVGSGENTPDSFLVAKSSPMTDTSGELHDSTKDKDMNMAVDPNNAFATLGSQIPFSLNVPPPPPLPSAPLVRKPNPFSMSTDGLSNLNSTTTNSPSSFDEQKQLESNLMNTVDTSSSSSTSSTSAVASTTQIVNPTSTIPAPFRVKIDFSKIQLNQGPPPNHVEKARREYLEAQKQWEQVTTN